MGLHRLKSSPCLTLLVLGLISSCISPICGESERAISVSSYDIKLRLDDGESFQSTVTLTAQAVRGSDVIVLNSRRLSVNKYVTVEQQPGGSPGKKISVVDVVELEDRDEVEIHLDKPLTAGGTYSIKVVADGKYAHPADYGLVRESFQEKGEAKWLLAIRNAPNSARSVFPCIDVPNAASKVKLQVWRPSSHAAVSNAPLNSTEVLGVITSVDTFSEATLAPHQIGLVVAPVASTSLGNFTFWARSQLTSQLASVHEYVSTVDDLIEKVYGVQVLPLSVVFVPGLCRVSKTAGLLVMNEEVLSLHERAPPSARRDAMLELAAALADPAVRGGALPSTWGDAWVPQSLAAFLQHRFADEAVSGWRFADHQVAVLMQSALEEGGRRINARLPSGSNAEYAIGPHEVTKGSLLFRMLNNSTNLDVFDGSLQRFYQQGTERPQGADDLYDIFTEEAYKEGSYELPLGATVPALMTSWADQPGYPFVTVIRDYEKNAITVFQKRFYWFSSSVDLQQQWWVPLSYSSAAEVEQVTNMVVREWLVPGEDDTGVEMKGLSSFDWVYFNVYQTAPYRVNYDVHNWFMLIKELRGVMFYNLKPAARAQLLGDALALARAGELDYSLALDLAEYLKQEDDMLPWLVARESFRFLEDRLYETEAFPLLLQLEARLLKDVYLDAEFDMGGQGDADVRLLREVVVRWACEIGMPACLGHVEQLYRQWAVLAQPPHPEVMEAVLCHAVSRNEEDVLRYILDVLAGDSLVGGERRPYVRALVCAPSAALLKQMVEEALNTSGSLLAAEVGDFLEAAISKRPFGWQVVAEYLELHPERVMRRTGQNGDLDRLLYKLASKVSSQEELMQVSRLVRVAERWVRGGGEALAWVLEEASINLGWEDRFYEDVLTWLLAVEPVHPVPTGPTTLSPASSTASTTSPPESGTTTTTTTTTSTTNQPSTTTPGGSNAVSSSTAVLLVPVALFFVSYT